MKHLPKTILSLSLMAMASSSFACCEETNPYMGAEFQSTWMKGKTSWKPFLNKTYPGVNLLVGSRFHQNAGVELGYDWSKRKTQNTLLSTGQTLNSRVRISGAHLDVNGYLPVMENLELLGSLGVGFIKPKFNLSTDRTGTVSVSAVGGKTKAVARLGLGLQGMVNEKVGLRATVRYLGTSRLRVSHPEQLAALGVSNKPFKDATALNLGAFVKF
ncbi:MAG: hypothetical protein JWM09_858 [Francisellaceae bacterium]|nr:hypothetical protein [Francisellaceae bacterium]